MLKLVLIVHIEMYQKCNSGQVISVHFVRYYVGSNASCDLNDDLTPPLSLSEYIQYNANDNSNGDRLLIESLRTTVQFLLQLISAIDVKLSVWYFVFETVGFICHNIEPVCTVCLEASKGKCR